MYPNVNGYGIFVGIEALASGPRGRRTVWMRTFPPVSADCFVLPTFPPGLHGDDTATTT